MNTKKLSWLSVVWAMFLVYCTHVYFSIKFIASTQLFGISSPIPWSEALKSGILNSTERVDIDVDEALYSDRPKQFGLMTIMDKLRRGRAATTNVMGFEERESPDVLTGTFTAASSNNAAVNVTLASGLAKHCYVGMTLQLLNYTADTGMVTAGHVTAVDTTNNIIEVKNIVTNKKWGSKSGKVHTNARLLITGNWNEELASSVTQPTILPNKVVNNTQTIRDNYIISLEAERERMYGMPEAQRAWESVKYRHARNIYKALLFNGTAFRIDQTSQAPTIQKNYQQGIESTLLDYGRNVQYTGPADMYDSFQTYQFGIFDLMLANGSDKRLALCNKAAKKFFTDLKKDKGWYIFNNDEYMDVFGIPGVKTVETDQGQFDLLVDGIVDRVYPNINEPYIMGLHLRYIELKDFLKTTIRTNIQPNDVLGRKDEAVTIFTNLVWLAEASGIWRRTPTGIVTEPNS